MTRYIGPVGRGQPIGLIVGAGRLALDINRQRAIGVFLQLAQHRRIDEVAIDRVFDQKLRLAVIHRNRPEGVDRRQRVSGECQRVGMLTAIERLPVAVTARGRV